MATRGARGPTHVDRKWHLERSTFKLNYYTGLREVRSIAFSFAQRRRREKRKQKKEGQANFFLVLTGVPPRAVH